MGGFERKPGGSSLAGNTSDADTRRSPGKLTLTEQLSPAAGPTPGASTHIDARMVQLRAATAAPPPPDDPREIAASGVSGSGQRMPHADAIIASFGEKHQPAIEGIRAHIGGDAAHAAGAIGAEAYATGDRVAFASAPDLGLAAHEAAHVVQQRAGVSLKGGVGEAHDAYEQHADAVADAVVRGDSAGALLAAGPSGGGAAAIQRRVTVNPGPAHTEPDAAVQAKTVNAFVHYSSQQADWSTHYTAADKPQMQQLLHDLLAEPALQSGLGDMIVSALIATPAAGWVALRAYSQAVANAAGVPTAKMDAVNNLARAIAIGNALPRLQAAVGNATTLFHITAPDSVNNLIRDGRLEEFIQYCAVKQPQWHAPDGKEFDSFNTMSRFFFVRVAMLTDVRNLHHFDDAALVRLQADKAGGHAGRPLALILHTGLDYSGAFHHDAHLTSAVTGNPNRVAMIEGRESLANVETAVTHVSAAYGGAVINQVMIAGHGESRSIEQAGKTQPGVDAQGRPEVQGVNDDLDLDGNGPATEHFFKTLLGAMGGANSRIVFNGCLTASNDVRIDPASPDPPQVQIANQLRTNPSLVDRMRQMVGRGGGPTILGGNASFPEGPDFLDARGNFDINWSADDPALTSQDRLDYVRRGIEPTGVLRAVMERWEPVPNPAAPPAWFAAVQDRNRRPTTTWDGAIITRSLAHIATQPNNAQLVSDISGAVADISECFFTDLCRVARVNNVPPALRPLLFGAVEGSSQWPGEDNAAAIPIYQVWARSDASKYAALLTHLTAHSFTTTQAEPYLDWTFLNDADLGQLLPAAARAAPTRGHLLIAAANLKSSTPSRIAREFLAAIARANGNHFPAALNLGAVAPNSTEDELLRLAGVTGPGAPASSGGPTVVDANVDANSDRRNERYIERTAGFGVVVNCSVLTVHAGPGNAAREIGFLHAGDRVFVQGTRDGWCSIDFNGHTGYVWRRFLNVT